MYPNVKMRFQPKEQGGYLSHIGFYQACGIKYGNEVGAAKPSSNYVPITGINLYGGDFYRTIDKTAEQLAATLEFDSGLQQLLTYLFIETIRNVFEHADIDSVYVAAQKWPTQDLLEIAIADAGCGISGSLGKLYATEKIDLLRMACKPGITARSNFRYLERDDPWRNSGYGLYIMKELAIAYNGSFTLCSGCHALRFYKNEYNNVIESVYDTDYAGTAICLRFKTNTDNCFGAVRNQIVSTGQLEAAKIEGAIRTASRSSGGRYHMD